MASSRVGGGRVADGGYDPVAQKQAYLDKANVVTDESLASTRRMVGLIEESKESAVGTMVQLDEQGEQLRRVEEGLDDINIGIRDAETHIEDMEKCCGLCILPWKRFRKFETTAVYKEGYEEKKGKGKGKEKTAQNSLGGGGAVASGPYVQRVMDDAREDEMEENLDDVGRGIAMLKDMALDMGTTIDEHNDRIGRITDKAESNEVRMARAQNRMDKLAS